MGWREVGGKGILGLTWKQYLEEVWPETHSRPVSGLSFEETAFASEGFSFYWRAPFTQKF